MNIEPYIRKPFYYETDQMGVIHHSNYIRWFEEARVSFMEQMGFGYDKMESEGIVSPVLSVACEYKTMVRFGETVVIQPSLLTMTGARMIVSYQVTDLVTGELRAFGETRHCFLNQSGRPVSLQKVLPDAFDKFRALLVAEIDPKGGADS